MFKPYNKAQLTFDLVKEIGQSGRNSKTYISRDHQLDAEIVIKQIAKKELASPENFFDESKALYASAHPNVVQIHYACEDAESIYLAMPYYRRGSVKEMITGKHMTVREVVAIGCNVLTGLHNIHSKKLIHFDVKPDNVLISDRGEGLLSDFGLAKQMNFSGIAGQDRLYTPMTPPEATRGDHFDVTFDIYQVGLTFYRMCNGNDAFYEQLQKYRPRTSFDRDAFRFDVRNGRFPDRKTFAAHVPSKLRNIVKKCLALKPDDRFQSAIDCANALALVDGTTLDWRLSEINGTRIWSKNENGTSYELTVKADGEATCYKSVNGGNPRRVSDGCASAMSEKEITSFLASY
ncbi:serine/threonine-protein kinase [Neoroseomonas soli]|uniref:Serine/threonine protein kinase n=1 Tax=Neoroseomonas soli TaxID=1081025 RepID=A0A9X9WZJ1_9PROT|nr:serine/threonine-protein kinase [Neoroseomonas soli]MBR0672570.1 serine/threonine protein kinase [Neoroseomonas soli]